MNQWMQFLLIIHICRGMFGGDFGWLLKPSILGQLLLNPRSYKLRHCHEIFHYISSLFIQFRTSCLPRSDIPTRCCTVFRLSVFPEQRWPFFFNFPLSPSSCSTSFCFSPLSLSAPSPPSFSVSC